ncbi:MAG: UbiX family flavin prenyltransferase [Alphaproteobacteria bacterium]|nr:UbiX family flavin prenyltransferase [Rhizobiaceae bacterium]MBU3960318.1 UbiX family flavin prenyltransferase [Alphaproteobacteria bacterium]MBU4048647.1 UbiX family flavin prenyltransferase [Alphaproteobacteria bacterium]MBU4088389.1 UbiX family flavin prenyltransferase [Alphaproteobacteria bacterium]MBU4157936.1 UbiX family flavin prenyltransferase [Alphaproteobacteria bacterium]
MSVRRVVLGVSGASGAPIAMRIAERLAALAGVETHLVVSTAAERTFAHELGEGALARLEALAIRRYAIGDIGAAIASGSFRTAGMIVAPCSMRSLSGIATGLADTLLIRAADVHLKERRPLVLLARETPLHLGHLRNMVAVTEMGAIVMPPVPAFYRRPETVAAIVDHIAARAIDLLRITDQPLASEWSGDIPG